MEAGKYALSCAGSYGKLRQAGRKIQYCDGGVDGDGLFGPGYGINFSEAGAVLL